MWREVAGWVEELSKKRIRLRAGVQGSAKRTWRCSRKESRSTSVGDDEVWQGLRARARASGKGAS